MCSEHVRGETKRLRYIHYTGRLLMSQSSNAIMDSKSFSGGHLFALLSKMPTLNNFFAFHY